MIRDEVVLSNPVTEVKTTLSGKRETFLCESLRSTAYETVVSYRLPQTFQLEDLLLPRGTLSLGYFWLHKPFNLYHWLDDNRQTLALYFNVCDNTRFLNDQICWRDLCVDVLITPDHKCRVLDEDELPEDLDETLLAYINNARDQLSADPAHLMSAFIARSEKILDGIVPCR